MADLFPTKTPSN